MCVCWVSSMRLYNVSGMGVHHTILASALWHACYDQYHRADYDICRPAGLSHMPSTLLSTVLATAWACQSLSAQTAPLKMLPVLAQHLRKRSAARLEHKMPAPNFAVPWSR